VELSHTHLSLYDHKLVCNSHTDVTQDFTSDAFAAATIPIYLGLGPAHGMLGCILRGLKTDGDNDDDDNDNNNNVCTVTASSSIIDEL